VAKPRGNAFPAALFTYLSLICLVTLSVHLRLGKRGWTIKIYENK